MPTVDFPSIITPHYRRSGSGTPIVFLHGCLMGANLWHPVIRLLDGEFGCLCSTSTGVPTQSRWRWVIRTAPPMAVLSSTAALAVDDTDPQFSRAQRTDR